MCNNFLVNSKTVTLIKDTEGGYLQLSLFWDMLLFLCPFFGVEEARREL